MVQNLNCSCCFITGNIKVTCAKVFWLQITYRDCTISQTSKGLLQFHSQTKNIWTFFSYTSKYSLWQALHCSALHEGEWSDGNAARQSHTRIPKQVCLENAVTCRCPGCLVKSRCPGAEQLQHTTTHPLSFTASEDCSMASSWISELAMLHDVNISWTHHSDVRRLRMKSTVLFKCFACHADLQEAGGLKNWK